jgi:glucose/arabinose dehydrogenase/regulation of enolase protein 1 (concanavalin A-like superfamily)
MHITKWICSGCAVLGILWGFVLPISAQPYGLNTRPAIGPFLNDTMPEAAPTVSTNWSVVPAFPNLVFTNALGFTHVPGTNLLCVWEREGRVWFFPTNANTTQKWLVLDLSNQCQGWDDSGLLNLAFHPGFVTNRYLFVYYTWVAPGTVIGSPTTRPPHTVANKYHDRLSRFTLNAAGTTTTNTEVVFVDQTGNDTWHNGGGLFFHPANGFLYWTDGDDASSVNRQVITNKLFSGVFRIDVDMRGGSISHPIPKQPNLGVTANYYIPNDNPFVGQPNGLEEFFCLGLRSPHRMTIDPPTGRIYIGDVGESSREEISRMESSESGLNFQWSYCEGFLGTMPASYIGISKPPILDYVRTEGRAVIGGHVYRGSQFAAELGGRYIFGDNVTRTIWVMDEFTPPATKLAIGTLPKGDGPNAGSDYTGLSSFGLDANNEIYMCQMSSIGGRIYKLAPSSPTASRPLPTLLSQTGAFTNLTTLAPHPGLIPYTVNSPLWSDAAHKKRWLAIPTNTFVTFAPTGGWTFSGGSVFVKHFELSVNDTNPAFRQRLETRLLVRDTNGLVYGASYKWRPDYSDADLVNTLTNEDVFITTATGVRTQLWSYPGRQDCLTCHTIPSGGVLGVNTRQLNGDFGYSQTGVTDNQIRALNHVGLFSSPVSESAIPSYTKLTPVTDTNASLEFRVRSYLDANCAHCHRPNGGVNAIFDARIDTPLSNAGIVGGTVLNNLGIFGARVVSPTNLAGSILYQRDNSLTATKMPPLAKNTIDADAMAVIAAWINALPPLTNSLPPPWQHADLGGVGVPGDASHLDGQFTITASGNDIWGMADGGHFTYMTLTGDGEIKARVVSVQNTDPWAKAGVMFRETLADNSTHAFAAITAANGAVFQRRPTTGGASENTDGPEYAAPSWVRVVRAGNLFTAHVSTNGNTWTQIGSASISMATTAYVGLAVTAHNNAVLNSSVFDNVAVIPSVNFSPTVTIAAPTNGAMFAYGANISLLATTTDDLNSVTNVSFFREITPLGQDSAAPFGFTWNNAPAGTFTLRATATDNFGASGTSAPVTINILAPLGLNAYTVKVNFQTNTSPLVPGYLPDYGFVYASRGNGYIYGWDVDNAPHSRYRNSGNSYDLRYDTFNHLQKPGGGTTWEIALPNGTYQVRMVSGDATATDGNFQLNAEGVLIVSGTPSSAARWLEGIGTVTVSDGRLTVGNASGSVNNKICFIEITSLAAPLVPTLLTPQLLPDGTLRFFVQGSDGVNYVVEASTNLVTWTPVFTNAPVGSLFQFIDSDATNHPFRFYRGRRP